MGIEVVDSDQGRRIRCRRRRWWPGLVLVLVAGTASAVPWCHGWGGQGASEMSVDQAIEILCHDPDPVRRRLAIARLIHLADRILAALEEADAEAREQARKIRRK